MSDTLKPCPFCEFASPRSQCVGGLWTITCTAGYAQGGCNAGSGMHESEVAAIAAWNRRATAPTGEPSPAPRPDDTKAAMARRINTMHAALTRIWDSFDVHQRFCAAKPAGHFSESEVFAVRLSFPTLRVIRHALSEDASRAPSAAAPSVEGRDP